MNRYFFVSIFSISVIFDVLVFHRSNDFNYIVNSTLNYISHIFWINVNVESITKILTFIIGTFIASYIEVLVKWERSVVTVQCAQPVIKQQINVHNCLQNEYQIKFYVAFTMRLINQSCECVLFLLYLKIKMLNSNIS